MESIAMNTQISFTRYSLFGVAAAALTAFVSACGSGDSAKTVKVAPVAPRIVGVIYTVRDTIVTATFDAAGVAAPVRQATLSTKLTGTVIDVLVDEGDAVAAGQPLVRIDARDLAAKSAQAAASLTEAEAMHRDAVTQANRIRSLYADSAAPRAQLDAAETALARAEAAVRVAQSATSELDALRSYAVTRAPFAGIVTKRFVDPGAFAAPGAPLVAIQDASTLRIVASVPPELARTLRRREPLAGTIEGQPVQATIEGVVPAAAGNLYVLNALVPNAQVARLAGSTATLALPAGARTTLVVPAEAVVREGDLTGVMLRGPAGDERRWVRLGPAAGAMVEVTAGLDAGDRVVVPTGRVARTGN
jgi:RND family efflux transporter MFP subunit